MSFLTSQGCQKLIQLDFAKVMAGFNSRFCNRFHRFSIQLRYWAALILSGMLHATIGWVFLYSRWGCPVIRRDLVEASVGNALLLPS